MNPLTLFSLSMLAHLPRALAGATLLLAFLASAERAAHAQDTTFVCDSSSDAVYVFRDLDLDGTIDPTLEASVFYDDSSTGPDLSNPGHVHAYGGGLLLADGGTLDAIFFLADNNGDGDANDDGEITPFYDDSAPGIDLATPNGIAIAPDGSIYISDDGSAVKGVIRLLDANNDGDANDADEGTVFFDASALATGPSEDPESIAIGPDGTVYVGDSTLGSVFALRDLNGDGDALDDLESELFYDGSTIPLADIDAIQVDADGVVYAVDEDNGTIVRLADADANGSIDSSEVTEFIAGTAITDANDLRLIGPSTFLVADGATDAVFRVQDLDGNGDAMGVGEVAPYFDDGGALMATPSGVEFIPSRPAPTPPVITSLSVSVGSIVGSTPVSIEGQSLTGATAVRFGGVDAVSFTVVEDGLVTAESPASSTAGPVDVEVDTPGGTATLVDGFMYLVPFLRGDVNGNGVVQVSDAIGIIEWVLGLPSSTCPDSLDANDDDAVEISDAVYLLTYLFQFGAPPSAPFPAAGLDPTPGLLGCD